MKIWEKSRRIGATYVQAYEDVRDAATNKGMDVWFSSADASAAKEYILYCAQWARLLNIAAHELGEVVLDRDKDIKALVIELANGKRIHGLSSNPRGFRSKGGKVVLDEFAFHDNADELWRAAVPVITWGYPIRVLSTYNGKGNRYYRLVEDAKRAKSGWSLHSTPITQAVADGLADKIAGKKLPAAGREAFVAQCRETAGDEDLFRQEYMCVPIDAASAWLTWNLISGCEADDAGRPELYRGNTCWVGMDIARRRDLTVIWVLENHAGKLWTREVVRLKRARFAYQRAEFERVMKRYKVARACVDQTGMGEALAEDLQTRFGAYRVEGVLFSGPTKLDLATGIKTAFEDDLIRLPADTDIRNSHHAVKRVMTSAGNPRFDADRSETGHADEFWAHALAIHAASNPVVPIEFKSVPANVDSGLIGFGAGQDYSGYM